MKKSLSPVAALDIVIASLSRARKESHDALSRSHEMRRIFAGVAWLMDDNIDVVIERATRLRGYLEEAQAA
jgi:hypothetical protein